MKFVNKRNKPAFLSVENSWFLLEIEESIVALHDRWLTLGDSPLCGDFLSQLVFTFQCNLVLQSIVKTNFKS